MRSLLKIKPTLVDKFHQHDRKDDLSLGVLYFDEQIGTIREHTQTVIYSDEPDVLTAQGIFLGQSESDRQGAYMRRTWVRPYPTEELARMAFEYESQHQAGSIESNLELGSLQYSVTHSQLEQVKNHSKPGFFAKLLR